MSNTPLLLTCTECRMSVSHKLDCSLGRAERLTFTLAETALILKRRGIDTDVHRLAEFLNTGICWTDGFGDPRLCADGFLDGAGGKVTVAGVNELVRVMGMAV